MHELRTGVWYWQSPHPDWDEAQMWPAHVLAAHGRPTDRTALQCAFLRAGVTQRRMAR
jgi:hypothetical protein